VSAALALLLLACAPAAPTPGTLVLPYAAFGPQVLAHEILGMEWYQWDPHGDSDPKTTYDVRVVVRLGVSESEAKRRYPVQKAEGCDYRYVTEKAALEFLARTRKEIAADSPELAKKLADTAARIRAAKTKRGGR
jgi:hypothetical protein